MKSRICLLLASLLATSNYPLLAQTPAQTRLQQQDDSRIRIGTSEVSLDVIVRDKKGHPVRDLSRSDFEVYEDGARQNIESFRLVLREPGTSPGGSLSASAKSRERAPEGTGAAPTANSSGSSGLIALVFDRLSPEARTLARKAATAYADEGLMANDFTGVFAIDLSLLTLQQYTDRPQLVRQAIEAATSRSTSTYASSNEQVRSLAERSAALDRQAQAGQDASSAAGGSRDSAGASAAGGASGQAVVEQAFVQMQMQMSETFEALERNQQGYATINGLLALANSMRNLPGRKTIVFFSEGLALPPAVAEQFRSVISAANRAGVSVYAVDAAGLRIDSPNLETTREINSMADRRMNQVHRSQDPQGPLMKALERNEDLLRLNPHSGLGQLADQTGGFLIHDTNDLSMGLRRIDEDMRVHYVLTYVPKNQDYDGRFRQISLKVSRANLDVQTRKGYYAVDNTITSPVLGYEAPAIGALSRAHGSNQFGLRVGALSFPEPQQPGLTPVLVEVPASAFTFTTDNEKKTFSSDFSILVLVRDASKNVVDKLSQHYPLSGTIDKLDAARKGEILFYREAELKPGRYTLEAVAYDAPTGKASVGATSLDVPAGTEQLRMSSLVLLKRADRLTAEEQKKDQPLHFGEVVVYPNLGEPIHKSARQLAFFFTTWPSKGSEKMMKLTLEVLQNGRSLAQIPADLPPADEHGRIKYASALPIENFPVGSYELKVTVTDGRSSTNRTASFKIES
jgi:VWFA-related protein